MQADAASSTTVHVRCAPRLSRSSIRSPHRRRCTHASSSTGTSTIGPSPSTTGTDDRCAGPERRARPGDMTRPWSSRRGFTLTTRGPGSNGPVRSLGPPKSIAILQGRPSELAPDRTKPIICFQAALSSCAQLMRATSMPCRINSATTSSSAAASVGNVTMIRVER